MTFRGVQLNLFILSCILYASQCQADVGYFGQRNGNQRFNMRLEANNERSYPAAGFRPGREFHLPQQQAIETKHQLQQTQEGNGEESSRPESTYETSSADTQTSARLKQDQSKQQLTGQLFASAPQRSYTANPQVPTSFNAPQTAHFTIASGQSARLAANSEANDQDDNEDDINTDIEVGIKMQQEPRSAIPNQPQATTVYYPASAASFVRPLAPAAYIQSAVAKLQQQPVPLSTAVPTIRTLAEVSPAAYTQPLLTSRSLAVPAAYTQPLVTPVSYSQTLINPDTFNQPLAASTAYSQPLITSAAYRQQFVVSTPHSQTLVAPASYSQPVVASAAFSQPLVTPAAAYSQRLVTPAAYSQPLVNPAAAYRQPLFTPAAPAAYSQTLVTPTSYSQPLVASTSYSQRLVAPSTYIEYLQAQPVASAAIQPAALTAAKIQAAPIAVANPEAQSAPKSLTKINLVQPAIATAPAPISANLYQAAAELPTFYSFPSNAAFGAQPSIVAQPQYYTAAPEATSKAAELKTW